MSVGGQCMAQDRTCNGQANLFCIEESCGDEKYFCSPLEGDWKWRRAGECPYDGDIIHGFSQLPDEILVNVTWCNRSGTLFLPTLFDFTSSYSLRPHQDNDPQSAQVPTWIDDPDGDPSHGLLLVFKFDYTDPAQVIGNMSLTFAMANGTTSKAVKIMFKVSTIPLSIGDEGLDVSHWQSAMDWETAKGKGIKFTFMKATEGTYFHDDQFARNWAETKRLGIARGAYHYFRFDYDPEAQAAYFADAISAQGNDGELMPIANVEIGNSGYDSGEPKSSNANKIKRFLEKCDQLTGASCGIYTSAAMWNAVAGTTDWAHERPLWVADWLAQSPTLPDDWANKGALAIFWQYSGDSPGTPQDGREYGAQSTYVDHNRYINEGTFSACPQ
jgi:GH25 family lysozyme M1 (1,4-beta-N-acetylmuramidase)